MHRVIAPRKLLAGDAIAAIGAVGRPGCQFGMLVTAAACAGVHLLDLFAHRKRAD